ncbi:hypothetical protein, partial [Vibrio anguillarum]|uniref:hypothetical protein n=1 Tax=Vibrio anguillarum TaxID=55601 RepID=UPI001BE41733
QTLTTQTGDLLRLPNLMVRIEIPNHQAENQAEIVNSLGYVSAVDATKGSGSHDSQCSGLSDRRWKRV